MNTDGFFVVNMGDQHVQLSLINAGGGDLSGVSVYLEGFSDPGISFVPHTHSLGDLGAGGGASVRFRADFTYAVPDIAYVSFIVEAEGFELRRLIKKIFVTRVDYHKPTKTYTVKAPQGDVGIVVNRAIMGPEEGGGHEREPFTVLIEDVTYTLVPKPPYEGVRGPLMYEDPWWKIAIAIVAGLILLGAALYDYFSDGTLDGGSASVKGTFEETNPGTSCCTSVSSSASQGEDDIVAKGLYSAAGTVATVAIASDEPDLHWRGQEATAPAAGERTVAEAVQLHIDYTEPPSLGVPYAIEGNWEYTRDTDQGDSYKHAERDRRTNTHVLAGYEVDAPSTHDRGSGPLIVRARFHKPDGGLFQAGELYVTGHLVCEHGPYRQFPMNDFGTEPDSTASDGDYAGQCWLQRPRAGRDPDPAGVWYLFVIAQDVNTVQEGEDPFKAAHTVGGIVLTTQLKLGLNAPCELNPDAAIHVT